MAMALVDGAVGAQEIEILAPFAVPYRTARSAGEHYSKGVIVMRCVCVFAFYGCFGRGGVIAGWIWCASGVEGGCGGFEGGAIGMVWRDWCSYWCHDCSAVLPSGMSLSSGFFRSWSMLIVCAAGEGS